MTLRSNYSPRNTRTVMVVGRNSAATAVVDAIGALPGVTCVRQMGEFVPATDSAKLAGADLVVDMLGGIAPAFTLAMATLGAGTAFVTANPLLLASHGRVLRNAANGQQTYFGFQAAGFGLPLAEILGASRPRKLTAAFSTAASMALARMTFRNESLAHVSAHLKMMQIDLSDWGGKQTQARAMALRALCFDTDVRPAHLNRASVETVEAADVKRLRAFGLQPVFGAEITEHGIYAGPMAVAPGSPLLNTASGDGMDVLVADTEYGDLVFTQSADEIQRLIAGIVADVRQYIRAPRPALSAQGRVFDMQEAPSALRAYVRLPVYAKEHVLSAKPEILQERDEGDGLWQAVVEVASFDQLRIGALGGVVLPLGSAWQASAFVTSGSVGASGLRLVG